ncbi:Malonyl CoA-acyl carrier protein transacylase [Candidatus Magnetomoraceae bacterium gMMP-13]
MEKKYIGLAFPGQGAQRHGMGKDFFENISICRHVYEEASDSLSWDVAAMCFKGDDRLFLTEFGQPCILTTEIAMLRGLGELYEFTPDVFGGHSLGEFTGLAASGALPFAETVQIVHARGKLMQKAMPVGSGTMAAVIANKIDPDEIQNLLNDLSIDIANINSANQVVISGDSKAMPDAEHIIKNTIGHRKSFRFIKLKVSAPFHSRFMKGVHQSFEKILKEKTEKLKPEHAKRVTSNFTGNFHLNNKEKIIKSLVSQLSNKVNWHDNMDVLSSCSHSIYELGPGRPLKAFFKSIGVNCKSIVSLSSAKKIFE